MKNLQFKKLIMIGIGACIFLGTYLFAANFLPIKQLSRLNNCSETAKIYLSEHNYSGGLWDYYLYLRSNFRLTLENPPAYHAGQIMQYDDPTNTNNTTIWYYAPETGMLKKRDPSTSGYYPLDDKTFKRMSRVFPYNQRVRGIDTNNTKVVFIQPNDPLNNIISIVYSYKYSYAKGYTGNTTSPYRYNRVSSGADMHGLTIADYVDWAGQRRLWSEILSVDYCKNYSLHRCGDGKLDEYSPGVGWVNRFTGEVCDNGSLNGITGCNLTCTSTQVSSGYFCGDKIINDGSFLVPTLSGDHLYGPKYFSGNIEIEEQCDDGPWDDSVVPPVGNHDGAQYAYCSSYCEKNTEPETLPEELGQ